MSHNTARLQKRFIFPTDQISKYVSHFSMGFVHLRYENHVQIAECAGSGTFVSIGSIEGILTAAHVVDSLPKSGEVGICLSADTPEQFAAQKISMEHTDFLLIGSPPFGQHGPDLAFIRPPPDAIAWMKAKASFFNLSKRRDAVLSMTRPSEHESDVVVGLIDELTENLPPNGRALRQTQFGTLFGPSRLASLKYLDPHNLLYYEPSNEFGLKLPKSYQGMSGGGVWRFYLKKKDEELEVIDRRLIGVAFHQLPENEGKRRIVCHGDKSLYRVLIDKVGEKWPEAVIKV